MRSFVYAYIYIYATLPLLSTHLGLLNRVFGVENPGLAMCMDESLGHRYLSLAALHGSGLADRRNQIQQSYSHPSSVKKATSLSRAKVLAMATVKVKNESHRPKLSQNHSPSHFPSQRFGHGQSHSPSQIHATIRVIVRCFFQQEAL